MAYIKNTWVDQEVERPRTYQKEDHADGSFTLIDDFGLVSELGTPVNADNMNHIEEGIGEHEERITALENLPDVYLKTNQITNCITKIPQRIKADVVDGTLTVYAGTVVIVPYGTEDKTSEFPVGSTFIHENFKVVDTQFADNKFFVWVEVQNHISAYKESTDTYTRMLYVNVSANTVQGAVYNGSGTTPMANTYYYNTQTNFADYYEANATPLGSVISLSLGLIKANGTIAFSTIDQVFNGMGYIGLSNWLDKDIKCLIPNYRNDDGTLKNTEWTNSKFSVFTNNGGFANRTNQAMFLDINDNVYFPLGTSFSTDEYKNVNYNLVFDTDLNKYFYRSTDEYVPKEGLVVGFANFDANSNCTSFNPKQPFRAVDYSEYTNDIDGKWTVVTKTIFSDKTFAKGASATYNCKDILPNDGNLYECIFRSFWSCGGKVAGAYVQGVTWGSFGKTLWWQDASTIALLQGNGTYSFGNMSSSEVQMTGCSLILLAYRKVR